MSPESTERLLAFMVERRDDILANLAHSDQEALFEAFSELSLYAATIPDDDERELSALSQVISEILIDLELDEVLPDELIPSGSQVRGMSGEAKKKAQEQAEESEHVRRSGHGPNIANQIHFFVGKDPLAASEIKGKPSGSLEDVLEDFFNR